MHLFVLTDDIALLTASSKPKRIGFETKGLLKTEELTLANHLVLTITVM
jgi:hypothetical protein